MNQALLFEPIQQPDRKRFTTIQARFEEFDRLNPQVRAKLVEMARELVRNGHKKIGMAMLYEVLRWHYLKAIGPVTADSSGYKLNDNYTSRYARKIMETCDDLKAVFETRTLHTP